jgi:sigma-B regulation protein RsbU (phosphoserine phosphatase)
VQIPENEIFAEIERQNKNFSLMIALLSLVMLCLAYVLISKFINSPIKRLTADVAQLALGNLDMRIEVSSKDEVGSLATAFNKMTADLKKSVEETTRERAEKERIAAELNVAAKIQSSMLPCIFPPFPDREEFDIYASMDPAKEVGGDFYDFYLVDKNNLAIVIADVSGKGIPAALFMVITKTLIRNCSSCKSPKGILEIVNNKLCENNEAGMFVTVFMGVYNIPSGKFTYVNAGHNPPLVKKRGKDFEFLRTKPCRLLGWMKDNVYREEELFLETEDALYLYTDGVTEAMNPEEDFFSEPRLLTALNKYRDYRPKELLSVMTKELGDFTKDSEQSDDITMLAVKVNAYGVEKAVEKELIVAAKLDKLEEVINFVNNAIGCADCLTELQNQIDVAVEEVFVNIASYAYEGETGNVTLKVALEKDKFHIRFEDSGKAYNPLKQPDPPLDQPLMEREIGGLGVFLVKKIMDKIEYSRIDNKNVLTMSKKIKDASAL